MVPILLPYGILIMVEVHNFFLLIHRFFKFRFRTVKANCRIVGIPFMVYTYMKNKILAFILLLELSYFLPQIKHSFWSTNICV